MKKIALCFMIMTLFLLGSCVLATEGETEDDAHIPSMSVEEFVIMTQAKQAKVDIIKKNNVEMQDLKEELKEKIVKAAEKINAMKIEISQNTVVITEEQLSELKELLQFLQDSKDTLEVDVERTLSDIDKILDLIVTKGMQLEQYDKLIEKQNDVIVKMKTVMATVEKI